jgi:hypothetical protein
LKNKLGALIFESQPEPRNQEGAMQQKMLGSQRYRQLADECRDLAQITTNSSWKKRYLELARAYDALAKEAGANPVGNLLED